MEFPVKRCITLCSMSLTERRGEGETMTMHLGSPNFLRMFPTVVFTLQLSASSATLSRRSGANS
jgi:hypothetical protein